MIAEHPYVGQPRDELFPGCREFRVEQHHNYDHLVKFGSVEVVRILHQRQDPGGKVTLPNT
jgi:plasmid stabilization system protein ParE